MTVITVSEKPGAVWRANENKFLETLRQTRPFGFSEEKRRERMRHHLVRRLS